MITSRAGKSRPPSSSGVLSPRSMRTRAALAHPPCCPPAIGEPGTMQRRPRRDADLRPRLLHRQPAPQSRVAPTGSRRRTERSTTSIGPPEGVLRVVRTPSGLSRQSAKTLSRSASLTSKTLPLGGRASTAMKAGRRSSAAVKPAARLKAFSALTTSAPRAIR